MDVNTFEHLERLSKLTFGQTEKEKAMAEMSDIIALMDTIKDFDLNYDDKLDKNEVPFAELRKDEAVSSFSAETLLQNTESLNDCYVIPKMME